MQFAPRLLGVHRSYIREILKVTARPEVISFAGGLPNPDYFPVEAMRAAAGAVLAESGPQALQYATTEGFAPLREAIARRYREKKGLDVTADNVLVTTGSQQALDLAAKVLVSPGDEVVVERPGYLGALQCFSLYGASFSPVELTESGIDTETLNRRLAGGKVRLIYSVPRFQNPSGLTYDLATRHEVARLVERYECPLIEDDPYGELRFMGEDLPLIGSLGNGPVMTLGSFSKIVSPGLRLGWIATTDDDLMHHLVTVKQASDLHTSSLTQQIVQRYLADNDLDAHIASIRKAYGAQREAMVAAMEREFPDEVAFTRPEGGMFLWATLPEETSAEELFQRAIAQNVAFVPGKPFYTDGTDNAFRLNFSNATVERIEEGIARLGKCLREFLT